MKIRFATTNDCSTIAAFNQAMALETEQIHLPEEQIFLGVKNLIAQPALGFYIVAEIENEIVGSLMISYEWSDWRNGLMWWLQSVYVKPSHRKQQVFKSMLKFIEESAAEKNVVCIRLYMDKENARAHQTYIRSGFEETNYLIFEKK